MVGPDRRVVQDALRVVPHPVGVDHPSTGPGGDLEHRTVHVVRHPGDHRLPAAPPARGPVLPDQVEVAADATAGHHHGLGGEGELARSAAVGVGTPRGGLAGLEDRTVRRVRRASSTSSPVTLCRLRIRTRWECSTASANGCDQARTGAPGDVEAGHASCRGRARCSRRARPTGPAGTSAHPRPCSQRRFSPAAKCTYASAQRRGQWSSGRSNAALPSQSARASSARVADPQPPLLGGVDQEQPAERPVRLPAERLAAVRRRRSSTERPASASSRGGDQPGEPGPDDDDVRVHGRRILVTSPLDRPWPGENSLPWAVCRLSAPWPPIRCPGTADGWPPSWPPPVPTRPWRSAVRGRLVVELPTSTPADVAAAAARGPGRAAGLGGPAPGRASAGPAGLPRRAARPAGRARRPAAVRGRQGAAERDRGGAAPRADRALLRPGRPAGAAHRTGRAAWSRCSPGSTSDYVPQGLVGIIAPWNYPLSPDDLRRSGRAGRRQRGPAQAGPADAVRRAGRRRPAARGRPARRSVAGGLRRRRPGRARADRRRSTTSASPARPRPAEVVARQCAERLIGCSLELGGKNPLLVLDDADVETAAAGAVRGLLRQRRSAVRVDRADLRRRRRCTTPSPSAFVARTRTLRSGRSLDYEHEMGGLVSAAQLERVEAHVEDARAKGATVLTGGRRRPDLGTALLRADGADRRDRRRWTATPGRPSARWSASTACATRPRRSRRANDSEYGLNASVWTSDPARGRRVAGTAALRHRQRQRGVRRPPSAASTPRWVA